MLSMSSAEQSRKLHSLESTASVGCIRPETYCDTVGFDTPMALAISVLVLPEVSISLLRFSLICSSNGFIRIILGNT